jgi:hypothetical protein
MEISSRDSEMIPDHKVEEALIVLRQVYLSENMENGCQ